LDLSIFVPSDAGSSFSFEETMVEERAAEQIQESSIQVLLEEQMSWWLHSIGLGGVPIRMSAVTTLIGYQKGQPFLNRRMLPPLLNEFILSDDRSLLRIRTLN
jgi:hypothetical protein